MDEPTATRREVDQLRQRVDTIDTLGTRGTVAAVTTMAAQLAEAIRDIGELRGELRSHDARHDRESRERTSGRRWLIGTLIALAALIVTVLAIVIPLALGRT
jgi:Flp pilus assembly protein TadB